MKTPHYTIRLPLYLREAISASKKEKTTTAWILEAIEQKLIREERKGK